MKNSRLQPRITVLLCLVMLITLLAGCKTEPADTQATEKVPVEYTVEVLTVGQKVMSDTTVSVYTDESLSDLIAVGKTDADGLFTFTAVDAEGAFIQLQDVPTGYQLSEGAAITGEHTTLELNTELLSVDKPEEMKYELGGVFADLEITAVDGQSYRVSELLAKKKAVVLNFWYLNCDPCKAEFPFLQDAYEMYKDDIEVIALNPVDGTLESVAEFQKNYALAFPMAPCVGQWQDAMGLTAYPTTVVIDRYGTIAFMHRGSITDVETFTQIFEYFTCDDYKQVAVRNLKDLK